jgi:murein DD-endopeptidase MepM/ murein hydrolase activator NlpD
MDGCSVMRKHKIDGAGRLLNQLFRILLVSLIILFGTLTAPQKAAECSDKDDSINLKYGISLDTFQVEKDVVKRNQNLAKILLAYNVPYSIIDAVAKKSKPVFDVRKIRAGNPYCVIKETDPGAVARYFVYEQDPVNYVVYNLADLNVYLGNKKVETKIIEASGTIQGSLCKSFSRLDLNYELVEMLSGLYAWTIDFHHLQKGDRFKIIYEQKSVEGTPVSLGKILASTFTHRDEDFFAFYFEQEGRGGYYDENGNSMQKAFLKAPVKYTRITSRPSRGRLHPILKVRKPHLGTDYAAPSGTPVYAVGDGTIIQAAYNRTRGKHISIRHSGIYKTEYLHLSGFKKGIKRGARVHRGQVIGYVGKTGLATGPHLCFRFWKNGKFFNHLRTSLPSDKSLQKKSVPVFEKQIAAYRAHLKTIEICSPDQEAKQVAKTDR